MAIDYVIDYPCIPKQELTTEGILERMKGEQRALEVISLFRRNGDQRPPTEMGFEFTRSTPEGDEETRVIVVQDLLDEAAALKPLEHHCEGCPANLLKRPFGCMGFIQYPISANAEQWIMDQLPVPDDTLVWLLLKQGIEEFKYDGASIMPLRNSEIYFDTQLVVTRRLGEFTINSNQVFEMIFGVGTHINPNHAALLLLFLHAINREVEANEIMSITPSPQDADQRFPFLILPNDTEDDQTTVEVKSFIHALYTAWRLNVPLILDV